MTGLVGGNELETVTNYLVREITRGAPNRDVGLGTWDMATCGLVTSS